MMRRHDDASSLENDDDWFVEYMDPGDEETAELLSTDGRSKAKEKEATTSSSSSKHDDDDRDRRRFADEDELEDDGDESWESQRGGRPAWCQPKTYVLLASTMAALGGILFGYDTGIISGAMLQLNDEFNLTCQQTELVISALMMGAVAASVCGGFLVDLCGRRATIIANDVVFLTGNIVLVLSGSFLSLVIGRLIVGFAVSLSATAECVYITEISPPSRRGLLVSLNELGITFGFLTAYLFNFLFISVEGGWRYMFGFGIVLAVVQGLGMYFLPPSPRYLVIKGKKQQARRVLRSLLEEEEARDEFEKILASVAEEKHLKMRDYCCGGGAANTIWPALFISVTLIVLQQISGQPTVLSYAPMIFREVGLQSNASSVLTTVGLGVVKFLVTIVFLLMIDKVGRRVLLMTGCAAMMVSLVVLGILIRTLIPGSLIVSLCLRDGEMDHVSNVNLTQNPFQQKMLASSKEFEETTEGLNLSDSNSTSDFLSSFSSSHVGTGFAVVAVFVYVAGYSIGFGPGTWLLMSEMFPSSVKGRAIAFATTTNWALQMITSITLLDLVVAVGTSWLFVGFGSVCAVSVLFVFFFVPETKGKSLEQITSDLKTVCSRRYKSRRFKLNPVNYHP